MAGFLVSPQVQIVEKDLSTIIPAVSNTVGAYTGRFSWGPVEDVELVSNENDLVSRFGAPAESNFTHFFSAANFLGYGSALRLCRIVDTATALNADTEGTGVLVKNEDDYESQYGGASFTGKKLIAKYPGPYGNSLRVSIADSTSFEGWEFENQFSTAPAAGEIHLIVYDVDGQFSAGDPGIIDKYEFLSLTDGGKYEDGTTTYYVDVLREKSPYIWSGEALTAGDISSTETLVDQTGTVITGWGTVTFETTSTIIVKIDGVLTTAFTITNTDEITLDTALTGTEDVTVVVVYNETFAGGAETTEPALSDITAGYDKFSDPEEFDISLIFQGSNALLGDPDVNADIQDAVFLSNYLIDLARDRRDSVAFVSPMRSQVVGNFSDEVEDTLFYRTGDLGVTHTGLQSSSYGVMDSGWKYQYDRYNDKLRWVPLNPDIAGVTARTDFVSDPWFSPAGYNRGQIRNVVKLAHSPNKAERDDLYLKQVNPVISTRGNGVILYGDKTLFARPSAFDRINVRRLFIVLEKAIATAAKFMLFELNDEFTRAQFKNLVEPFLRDVQGRRGIIDFKVVCDETNNTAEVIDRNEFVADIYIKPARSINFIILNFVAVRTSVEFNEITSSSAGLPVS